MILIHSHSDDQTVTVFNVPDIFIKDSNFEVELSFVHVPILAEVFLNFLIRRTYYSNQKVQKDHTGNYRVKEPKEPD